MSKSARDKTGQAAQTRAVLFDTTFLMTVHIIQLCGPEVQQVESGESLHDCYFVCPVWALAAVEYAGSICWHQKHINQTWI